ncbi:hypothetical protein Tco_0811030 [Tanacetum coccineum]
MINGERQLQALVDKKKVIITETSIRSDLNLEDTGGTDYLPTDTIFEELARMGYEKPSPKLTFSKAFFSPQWKFLIHTITQCLVLRPLHGTNSVALWPLQSYAWLQTKNLIYPIQANQEEGEDSDIPIDSQQTPITTQPSTSKPLKKQSRRKQTKNTDFACFMIGEALGSVQEQSDEEPKADELSQEQLQQLMIIVPEEGMNVEALQTNDKMEAGTTFTTLTAKLPILNPGDYNLWLMRIEQYFLMTDYSLWEVILNGNKELKRTVGETEQEY